MIREWQREGSALPFCGERIAPWRGKAHIGAGWAAFLGSTGDNRPHAHHALQVIAAFGPPVTLWTPLHGAQSVTLAVVPSDARHALLPSSTQVGLLYIDAESTLGRSLHHSTARDGSLSTASMAALQDAFECVTRGELGGWEVLLGQLALGTHQRLEDARISDVLDRLQSIPDLALPSFEIAAWAHLSPSRFAHRFRSYTGMPLRPYLRWLRLQRAASAMAHGTGATDAAHAAGFADAAHFSRTFQRHFGIRPSDLIGMIPT